MFSNLIQSTRQLQDSKGGRKGGACVCVCVREREKERESRLIGGVVLFVC